MVADQASLMRELLKEMHNLSALLDTTAKDRNARQEVRQFNRRKLAQPLGLQTPSLRDARRNFRKAGASVQLARELARVHCQRATELLLEFSSLYELTIIKLQSDFHDNPIANNKFSSFSFRLRENIRGSYRKTMQGWLEDTVRSIEQADLNDQGGDGVFNHEFKPVLEAAFNRNTRPPRADKIFLAKQSGMQYRQVHIWFQNRRRRDRLSSLSSSNASSCRGKTSNYNMKCHDSDATECEIDSEHVDVSDERSWSRASSFTCIEELTPFCVPPPAHAFPESYPPPCTGFPKCLSDFHFPKPSWDRLPSATLANSYQRCDLQSLTSALEELSLGDEPFQCPANQEKVFFSSTALRTKHAPVSPYLIQPLPAPLPSLIRFPRLPSVQRCS